MGEKFGAALFPTAKFGARALTKTRRLNSAIAVSVEGKPFAKGIYGLHMIPNPDSCDSYLFKNQHGVGKLQLRGERRCFARERETATAR